MDNLKIEYIDLSKLKPYKNNARKHKKEDIEYIKNSIKQFGFLDPIGIWGKGNIIVEGHGRFFAVKELGYKKVPCIRLDELSDEERRAYTLTHNKTAEMSSWDLRLVDLELKDLNIDMLDFGFTEMDEVDFENLEKRTGEEDDEYREFEEKFKPKKTTDDCFTPKEIYDAVKGWVIEEYKISEKREIIRPFYPGGDYEHYPYPENCVVIDNPPFSILAKIIAFYEDNKINYFLFAPHLTLFSNNRKCQYIVNHDNITYQNGASVSTSYITNMDEFKIRTAPELKRRIREAQKKENKTLPKYDYPDNIITAARLGKIANAEVDFKVKENQCFFVRQLDSQKETSTSIYGAGFLVSDKIAKEKLQADEKVKERKNKNNAIPEQWELSEREKEIIEQLNKND